MVKPCVRGMFAMLMGETVIISVSIDTPPAGRVAFRCYLAPDYFTMRFDASQQTIPHFVLDGRGHVSQQARWILAYNQAAE